MKAEYIRQRVHINQTNPQAVTLTPDATLRRFLQRLDAQDIRAPLPRY
jgi:hypothetical protein